MSAGKITQRQDRDKLRKAKQKHGLSRVDIQTHITHHLTENRKFPFLFFGKREIGAYFGVRASSLVCVCKSQRSKQKIKKCVIKKPNCFLLVRLY